jgi:tetratricopeptide (TPR) repeat protein
MESLTEQHYVDALRARWPHDEETSIELLAMTDEAVAAWPLSAQLWCWRAALIQLGSGDSPYTLDEALRCYEQALVVDPSSLEATEDIAHFYDAVLGDEPRADVYFERARALRIKLGMSPNNALEQTREG